MVGKNSNFSQKLKIISHIIKINVATQIEKLFLLLTIANLKPISSKTGQTNPAIIKNIIGLPVSTSWKIALSVSFIQNRLYTRSIKNAIGISNKKMVGNSLHISKNHFLIHNHKKSFSDFKKFITHIILKI